MQSLEQGDFNEFKQRGMREEHALTACNLGIISTLALRQRQIKKPVLAGPVALMYLECSAVKRTEIPEVSVVVCDIVLLIVYIAGCTQLTANFSYMSEQDYTRFEHIPHVGHYFGTRQHTTPNLGLV